jgi:hypothetical protein
MRIDNMKRLGFVALACLATAACTYPSQTIDQGSQSGHLYFLGAVPGNAVAIDGRDAGDASVFDGSDHVLDVSPGPHRVVVTSGGATIYDRQIYVGSDAKLGITVR